MGDTEKSCDQKASFLRNTVAAGLQETWTKDDCPGHSKEAAKGPSASQIPRDDPGYLSF